MSGTIDDDFFSGTDIPADDSFLDNIINSDTPEDADEKQNSPTDDSQGQKVSASETKGAYIPEAKEKASFDDFFSSFAGSEHGSVKKENPIEETAGLDENPFGDSLFKTSADSFGSAGLDENPFGDSLFGDNTTTANEEDDGNPFADFDKSFSSINSKEGSTNDCNPFADSDDENPFADSDDENPFKNLNCSNDKEQKKSPLDDDASSDENPFW